MSKPGGQAASAAIALIVAIAGIIDLFVVLGLTPTRQEKELLGIIVGAIAIIAGVIGLRYSVPEYGKGLNSGLSVWIRFRPIGIALVAFSVGAALVYLGYHASTSK